MAGQAQSLIVLPAAPCQQCTVAHEEPRDGRLRPVNLAVACVNWHLHGIRLPAQRPSSPMESLISTAPLPIRAMYARN